MTAKKYVPKKRVLKRNWRRMLKTIATFVNVHDEHSMYLWNVLSALRGPDEGNAGKFCTTGVIRYAAGIAPGPTWKVVCPDTIERSSDRKYTPPGHFQDHARKAFIALDLNWEVVNDLRD